ncbi:hypothetical protein CR513_56764, partial [Mucuna pruriens]
MKERKPTSKCIISHAKNSEAICPLDMKNIAIMGKGNIAIFVVIISLIDLVEYLFGYDTSITLGGAELSQNHLLICQRAFVRCFGWLGKCNRIGFGRGAMTPTPRQGSRENKVTILI